MGNASLAKPAGVRGSAKLQGGDDTTTPDKQYNSSKSQPCSPIADHIERLPLQRIRRGRGLVPKEACAGLQLLGSRAPRLEMTTTQAWPWLPVAPSPHPTTEENPGHQAQRGCEACSREGVRRRGRSRWRSHRCRVTPRRPKNLYPCAWHGACCGACELHCRAAKRGSSE